MAFVLGDQFSRANLLPVNHPLLSPFPPAPSPSLALSDGSPLTGTERGLCRACSSDPWVQSPSFLSLLKKYSLISNGDFTEQCWLSLSLSRSFLADKEEEEVEERRKPSGQAW